MRVWLYVFFKDHDTNTMTMVKYTQLFFLTDDQSLQKSERKTLENLTDTRNTGRQKERRGGGTRDKNI